MAIPPENIILECKNSDIFFVHLNFFCFGSAKFNTQNIYKKLWVRKYLQVYTEFFGLLKQGCSYIYIYTQNASVYTFAPKYGNSEWFLMLCV